MAEGTTPEIIVFTRDITLRWPCRRGDFLLWLGYGGILAGEQTIQCHDLWEMREGDHVTITNRLEDLPIWFRLHPKEVCAGFVHKLMEKFENGDYPSEPMDGPNLWRLTSGDRLAWVGADRPERRSINGLLAILDCRDCALAIGKQGGVGIEEFIGFGSPSVPDMNPEDAARCQAAVVAVSRLGLPRTWGAEWMLG